MPENAGRRSKAEARLKDTEEKILDELQKINEVTTALNDNLVGCLEIIRARKMNGADHGDITTWHTLTQAVVDQVNHIVDRLHGDTSDASS